MAGRGRRQHGRAGGSPRGLPGASRAARRPRRRHVVRTAGRGRTRLAAAAAVLLVTPAGAGAAAAAALPAPAAAAPGAVPVAVSRAGSAAAGERDWTREWGTAFSGPELPAGCGAYEGASGASGNAWSGEQVRVGSGTLRLTLERRTVNGRAWTSGGLGCFSRVQTYGRYEIRARVPAGTGLASSFVLWPLDGREQGSSGVRATTGRPAGSEQLRITNGYGAGSVAVSSPGRYADRFHEYVVEWRPSGFTVSVDGVQVGSSPRSYQQGRWLGILLGTGGPGLGVPGASTPLPATLLVDSVTVYRYTPGRGEDLSRTTLAERALIAERAERADQARRKAGGDANRTARTPAAAQPTGQPGGAPTAAPGEVPGRTDAVAAPVPSGPAAAAPAGVPAPGTATDVPFALTLGDSARPDSPGLPWAVAAAVGGLVVLVGVVRAAMRRHPPV